MENKSLLVIIGLLVIASIFLAIKSCSYDSPQFHYKPETSQTDLVLENALKKKDKQYANNIWILEKRNDSLFTILQSTKQQLVKAQEKVSGKQTQVRYLSMQIDQSKDTASKLLYCDSLQEQTENLIAEQQRKDSLYNEALCDQDSIIKNQDTALSVCQNHSKQLSEFLTAKVEEEKQLQQEITVLQKENARKTIVQKILTASALVLSGIAAALLIH